MDNHESTTAAAVFLILATSGAGGVAALGVATPFVASFFPSEKAKAAGAAVEIDVSKIESGQMMTAEWQGKPIWVVNRTAQQLKDLKALDGAVSDPKSEVEQQPRKLSKTKPVRLSRISLWPSVSAPTWAVRRPTVPTSHPQIWGRPGKAASSVRATARNST